MSSRGMLPKCTLFLSVNNLLIQADTATTSSAGMSNCNECPDVGTLWRDILYRKDIWLTLFETAELLPCIVRL